ncbi:hypothetical protein B0H14DRAFT_2571842 [Mycena olivaceomarginata]|nr:hypothetical protein B0H14DRAFT_2571842 [Mycena olivaceomarginata]
MPFSQCDYRSRGGEVEGWYWLGGGGRERRGLDVGAAQRGAGKVDAGRGGGEGVEGCGQEGREGREEEAGREGRGVVKVEGRTRGRWGVGARDVDPAYIESRDGVGVGVKLLCVIWRWGVGN